MFGNAVVAIGFVIISLWSSVYLIVRAERADTVESYQCVIPDPDPNLPCRVQMRRDVYNNEESVK